MSTHGSREEEKCTHKEGIKVCSAPAYARCNHCKAWRCFDHLEVQRDEGIMRCQKNCGEREKHKCA